MTHMQNLTFHTPFTGVIVDENTCTIPGVSLITKGEAEGHGLLVDDTTLQQVFESAKAAGKIPVKINHGSGLENLCGYLDSFRREENHVRGDWHLLRSHDETAKLLERAQVMPGCFGLSVAFKGKGVDIGGGKKAARCEELKAVDVVTSPAANVNGLFSAVDPRPRTQLGTFAPSATGAADPQTMARAYGDVAERKRGRLARIAQALRLRQPVIPENEPALSSRRRLVTLAALPTAHEAAVARTERNAIATAAAAEQRIKRQQLANKFIRQQKASEQQKAEKAALDEFYKQNNFSTPDQPKKRHLNPYLTAAASGLVGGAGLGILPILKKGVAIKTALKSAAAMGAGSAALAGGGTYIGGKAIRDDDPSDESAPYTTRAAIGAAIAGGAAGAAGGLLMRKIPGASKAVANLAKTWRPLAPLHGASPLRAAALGGLAGAGYGAIQGIDAGQQADSLVNIQKDRRTSKAKSRTRQLSSAARVHHFAQTFIQDEAGVPFSGRVARDRFVKRIREEDLDRRDRNLLRTGAVGAIAGALMPGKLTKGAIIKRALVGAGTGAAAVMGARAVTSRARDSYGEKDRETKRTEALLPLGAAAAIAAAGIKKRLTGRYFSAQVRDAIRLADRLENLRTL